MASLHLLVSVFLVDGGSAVAGGRLLVSIGACTMELLFEDGLWLNGLELGREVLEAGMSAAVASATSIGEVVGQVVDFVAGMAPLVQQSAVGCLVRGWITSQTTGRSSSPMQGEVGKGKELTSCPFRLHSSWSC